MSDEGIDAHRRKRLSNVYAGTIRPSKERRITEAEVDSHVTFVHVHVEMPIFIRPIPNDKGVVVVQGASAPDAVAVRTQPSSRQRGEERAATGRDGQRVTQGQEGQCKTETQSTDRCRGTSTHNTQRERQKKGGKKKATQHIPGEMRTQKNTHTDATPGTGVRQCICFLPATPLPSAHGY